MIREATKDARYWADCQAEYRRIIADTEKVLVGGVQAARAKRLTLRNVNNRFRLMSASYSAGCPLEECRELYIRCLHEAERVWDLKSDYVDLVWYVSLGLLFDVGAEGAAILRSIVDKTGYADRLLCALLHGLDPSHPVQEADTVPTPYTFAAAVLDMEPELAEKALAEYLKKHWYKGHRNSGWYDDHKLDKIRYVGYWSFETAALVKLLHLDDKILLASPYYPAELAQYRHG